jgi:diguanylate cyclase (GGDEF)-like protein
MVTDRPIRGARGGASAGVGAVCEAVVDRLAVDPGLIASVWLERGGRLRCVAGTGDRPGRVGVSPAAGAVGATFTAGAETVVATTSEPTAAEACMPIRSDGCVVGVLEVGLTGRLRAEDLDAVRRAADELGNAIAALGGVPAGSAAQRMVRHLTSLSALEDPHAIAGAILAAAIDLTGLESAALLPARAMAAADASAVRAASGSGHAPAAIDLVAAAAEGRPATAAIGPLGPALAALPGSVLAAVAGAAGDGTAAAVVRPAHHSGHAGVEPLRARGIGTLVAVELVAQGQPRGVLLLARRADRPVPVEDLELLELLAAHAATCLRTADLVRSLRERAATDPLTGLGHHATFHETLARTHRRPQTAVVLVDVDGFKRLNDTFGHQHGDQVLRAIAAALSSALRRGDTLFRIGGDEFAALLAVADGGEALEAGMRLRAAVAEARLGVTVSIGVAVPREAESDAALLDRADRALYRVKAAGRDGVAVAEAHAVGDAGAPRDPATPV